MQPSPAVPQFEPPLAMSSSESARRILWIVGLYRAICGATLLGIGLLVDLKMLAIAAPNTFITAAALYFVFGLATFTMIQRDPLPLPLTPLTSGLLAGDVICIALVMVAGGGTGGSLPILLFPQLAASGWLLRTRTAFVHASLASVILLGLDLWRLIEGQIGGAQPFQTGVAAHRFGHLITGDGKRRTGDVGRIPAGKCFVQKTSGPRQP